MTAFVETMMYQADAGKPWHKLGTAVDESTGKDVGASLQAAGLDWTVRKVTLTRQDTGDVVGESQGMVRSTDGAYLGTVGSKYEPVQNHEAMSRFQPLLDTDGARIETAGSLKGGRVVWVLAKLNGELPILGNDTVQPYLLFSHSHDGSLKIRLQATAVRVVCWNTLSGARSVSGGFETRHTKNVAVRLDGAYQAIQTARRQAEKRVEFYQALGRKAMNDTALREYACKVLFGEEAAKGEELSTRAANILERVEALAMTGRGSDLPGVRGTTWGAFNAVTDYVSHEYGRSEDGRLFAQWYGMGAQIIARAEAEAGAFAGLLDRPVVDRDFASLMSGAATV